MEIKHEERWVAERLAALEPQWQPNPPQARAMLDAKLRTNRHSWTWTAAAATAALCVAALAFPETRATAQELWHRLVLGRVDVVRVDLSRLPLHTQVTTNGLEASMRDAGQAEQKAGFKPYLPASGILSTNPEMTVSGPITVEQTIHVRDIESALGKMGASDLQVPAEWEGVTLRADIGPMVAANYPGDVSIVQALPIKLSVPSGFGLERFAETAFRSIGVGRWEARLMGQQFAAHPAWLLDIPSDRAVNIQQMALPAGPAMLIEYLGEKGVVERATVVRSTPDRMYAVSSRTREVSVSIASTLP